jgi:hypothetical protein
LLLCFHLVTLSPFGSFLQGTRFSTIVFSSERLAAH